MPAAWATYVRLRTIGHRRRRCRELFDWSDEDYAAAEARFCDWALAFDAAEQEGRMKRAKAEAEARAGRRG